MLPQRIKEKFYRTINGDIPIEDFEQWLYIDTELEKLLHPDDYLELISLHFKKSGAKHELMRVLKNQVDLGDYETYKLVELLKKAKEKTDQLPYILMDFYDLYCHGYYFLDELGLNYGLRVKVPQFGKTVADRWEELTVKQKQELLDSFSTGLNQEIDRVLGWLAQGEIILTGEKDEANYYTYKDLRTQKGKRYE